MSDARELSVSERWIDRVAIALEYAVVAAGCVYILAYVIIAFQRLTYPFDLEWMEGAMVDHVRRLLAGEKLYVPPTLAFVPFIYPPLYHYASALMALLTGIGLLPLRLVSFLCSLGCFLFVYRIVVKETGSRRAALVAVGMFAATYRAGGAWLDVARVDSLFLLLILTPWYLVRFGRSTRSWVIAGVCIALAALTKQTAIIVGAVLLLYAVIVDWRRGFAMGATFASVFGVATAILELTHRGWYLYYVFEAPARIQQVDAWDAPFWKTDILGVMPIAVAIASGYLVTQFKHPRNVLFLGMLATAFVGSAWASRLHTGAYDNVLIPAYVAISMLLAVATHALPNLTRSDRASLSRIGLAVLCMSQLYLLRYNPLSQLPSRENIALYQRLIRVMANVDGDVLLAHHGFFPVLAGKPSTAHFQAVQDVLRAGGGHEDPLLDEIQDALHQQRYSLIVLDQVDPWLEPELSRHYRLVGPVIEQDGLWPVTGYRTRPTSMFTPVRRSYAGH
jgi:4-amino-4-deoxy-L-arabinose transferase-like glycosyltransferase